MLDTQVSSPLSQHCAQGWSKNQSEANQVFLSFIKGRQELKPLKWPYYDI